MELDKVADVSHSIPCSWTTCPRGCPLTMCIVYWYTTHMLKSYRHKGVKQFAESGSKLAFSQNTIVSAGCGCVVC